MGDNDWLCIHCAVPMANIRPWPGMGLMAECPKCHTTLTQRHHDPAVVREEVLLAAMTVRLSRGPITADLPRWIRAYEIVAGAYKRELDFLAAKRCDDVAVMLRCWQRRGAARAAGAQA